LAKKLVFNYPEYIVLVIDKLDCCSSLNNLHPLLSLDEWPVPLLATATTATETSSTAAATPTTTATTTATTKAYPNFKFIHGDITDLHTVETAMIEYKIDTVLHLAAQTHVDKSFGESIDFTKNNVLGTHVMLEAARKVFCPHPFVKSTYAPGSGKGQIERDRQTKEGEPVKRFLFVSTDEVYGEVLLDKVRKRGCAVPQYFNTMGLFFLPCVDSIVTTPISHA
jgi:GDP-D-mannose dehydratase